jgi:hypothetical protein
MDKTEVKEFFGIWNALFEIFLLRGLALALRARTRASGVLMRINNLIQ